MRSGEMPAMSERAARRPDASRGPIDARSTLTVAPVARASSMARTPGQPERGAEQGVDRQVQCVGALEPGRAQVGRVELVRRASVGHEAPLPAGRHHDTDPTGSRSRDARKVDGHAVGSDRLDQRPACGIATDRGDQRRPRPEPAEPAGRVGRRPALHERHPARDVGAGFQFAIGRQHDVEHQVAQDDDPCRRRSARNPRHPRSRRSAGTRDRRHPSRIAGRCARPADRVQPPTMAGSHLPSR